MSIEIIEKPIMGISFDKLLDKVLDDVGAEHAIFATMSAATGDPVVVTSYSDAWINHYTSHNYTEKDPVFKAAQSQISPTYWHDLRGKAGYNEVFSAARDFNIPNQGVSIPVRGHLGEVGLLSVSANMNHAEWSKLVNDKMHVLQQNAVFMSDRISLATNSVAKFLSPQMSKLEKDVLQLAALGKSIVDIGVDLNLSDRIVGICLQSARTKLNALTTPQAIGRAILKGLIDPA